MSRGHGTRQRAIMDALKRPFVIGAKLNEPESQWMLLLDLAGDDPSAADLEATRRAIHRLADEGLVQTRHQYVWHRPGPNRRELACRLVMGDPLRAYVKRTMATPGLTSN